MKPGKEKGTIENNSDAWSPWDFVVRSGPARFFVGCWATRIACRGGVLAVTKESDSGICLGQNNPRTKMSQLEPIVVTQGELVIFKIFDFAEEANLEMASALLKEKRSRGRLEEIPAEDIVFPKPPLSYSLGQHTINLTRQDHTIELEARIFHTGNLSLSAWISIPEGMRIEELLSFSLEIENARSLNDLFTKEANRLKGFLRDASIKPRDGYCEDYPVFLLKELSRPCTEEDDKELLASLLLRERGKRRLSKRTVAEVFSTSLSYYQDDLLLIDWDSAILIDSSDGPVPAILEFASLQLQELRYYDNLVDHELNRIYQGLGKQKGLHTNLLSDASGRLLRSLLLTALELSEATDRVENSLKLIGDSYYARAYRLASEKFELPRYLSALAQKNETIRDVVSMVNAETESARSLWLEVSVVALIVIEVIMGFVGH